MKWYQLLGMIAVVSVGSATSAAMWLDIVYRVFG